jgi:DNA-binding MarR family transcriptional regulator
VNLFEVRTSCNYTSCVSIDCNSIRCFYNQSRALGIHVPDLASTKLTHEDLDAWRALLDAHALLVSAIERDLANAGMPPPAWYDVLWTLERAPDGQMRIHELADAVVLSRSGLSRLLDRMEVDGLLRRANCPSDRRGAFAVITDDGIAALRRMWPVYERSIAEHFLPQLGRDAHALRSALERVADSARRAG